MTNQKLEELRKFEYWMEKQFLIDCPETLDDDIPDDFDNWMGEIDSDSMSAYFLDYISQNYHPKGECVSKKEVEKIILKSHPSSLHCVAEIISLINSTN